MLRSITIILEATSDGEHPTAAEAHRDDYEAFAAALAAAGGVPAEVVTANPEAAAQAGDLIWLPSRRPELLLPSLPEALTARLILVDAQSDFLIETVSSFRLAGGLDSLALSRWARRVGMSTFGLCGKVDVARRAGLSTMGRQLIGGYSFLTANAPTTLPEMVCRYLATLHD